MKLSIPHINQSDINSVNKVLSSGWISTSSNIVREFEKKISNFCKTKYSVALNSGTSAIHLGLKVLGVGKDDEVIVPSSTFIATVNPVIYLGAKPIFFDVDEHHNLKIDDVINFIKNQTIFKNNQTINKKTKKIIKVIIVAHMWGRACNFNALKKLCKKLNIFILEDAAEVLGTFVDTKNLKHCGSIGDVGCLSFNANKIITTGSGGAIITDNKKIFDRAQYLSNQAKDDPFSYIHNDCGYNYKMNGICAALGISQLKRLKSKIKLRKKIYERYVLNFKYIKDIKILRFEKNLTSNYWMNIVTFDKLNFKETNNISQKLSKKNIQTRRVWRPLHLQKYLTKFQKYKIDYANKIYSNSLCLPSDDIISDIQVDKISSLIKKYYKEIFNDINK